MPYRYVDDNNPVKFRLIENVVDVTCTFPSPVDIAWYKIVSNAEKWELVGLDTRVDASNGTYQCTTPGSRTSVTLQIQRISGSQPIINTLEFYDRYRRRVVPALTTGSAYYTATSITDRPCTHTARRFESKTNESVSVEYIHVEGGIGIQVFNGATLIGTGLLTQVQTGTVFTYTGTPTYIELFDSTCSPLSNTSYIGGGIRVPEWVEVEFARPIAARSYYFSTPSVDVHPTWWRIEGWNGSAWVPCSVEKKHMYTDFSEFSDALTTVNYQKYRLYIYAMKGRTAADIVLFNLYDENGAEFIQLENQIDDKRTNADTIPGSIIGFRDDVEYRSPISITFRVPVRVRKVACVSLTGQWRLNDSTISSSVTTVDITAQTFTLAPVAGTNASLRTPELHGSRGRLNPILDSAGTPQSTYGGKSLSDGGITFQVILPGPISTYGNHYQLTTTANATIVDFELLGYKQSVTPTPLVRRSNLYARNVSISGSFSENNYDRYEVRVYEVSAVTLPKKTLDIIDFSILSDTYAPVFPIFRGQNDVDPTRELPVSIHGNYQIDLINGFTQSPFSNIFDRDPESVFATAGPFELAVSFPYPTRVSVVHVSFATSITTWSLKSDGGVTIASGTRTGTVYTGRSETFSSVTLDVKSESPVILNDFRLLNDFGEFIPKITGSGVSSRGQFMYGGTTQTLQTIAFDIPQTRRIQKIVFRGTSLPSNVVVMNSTGQIIGSSDSFSHESSVTVSDQQLIRTFTLQINRLRVSDANQRFQNIRLSDILIYDSNGYIILPEKYPAQTISNQGKRIQYTVDIPSREGYIYETAESSSIAIIDNLNTLSDIYGYRGRFIGAKTVEVLYNGIRDHIMRFETPFSNVYSNAFHAPIPLSNISFGVLSTFEGFGRAGIGNFNLLNQYYEPMFGGFVIGGSTQGLSEGEVYITYTFNPGKTIQTVEFETSKPAVCRVDAFPLYLPFGTYSVFGGSVGAFMGGYSVLENNALFRLRFPRKMNVKRVTCKIPNDLPNIQFTTNITITINNISVSIRQMQITRNSTNIAFSLNQECTMLDIRVVKDPTTYSIGVSDIRIDDLSLSEYGIAQGAIIEYIPPTKHTFTVGQSVTTLRVACREYYNDRNEGTGTITISNVTAENLLTEFQSNVKKSYEYDADQVVPGSSWVEMDLGLPRTITASSHTWDLGESFSHPVGNVLQVLTTTNQWVEAKLPVEGRKFRQFVPSITKFTNSGRIRLENWRLDTFPGEVMTSNTLAKIDILEEPSFITLRGTLGNRNN